MRQYCACLLFAATALPALAQSPASAPAENVPAGAALADLEPLTGEELGALRGGVLFAGGIAFEFGATVRTMIDGQPALETRLTWTPDGVVVEDLSAMTGVPLPEFDGFGLRITDASGTTLVGHRLLDGEIQSFILNSADNRNIQQGIDVTLTLPGFGDVQRGMLSDRLGFRIGMDVADGLIRASLP